MENLEKKIRVLIIDDSKFMRDLLEKILAADPDILIVGKASDPYVARDLIKKVYPHVLTLDVMMPGMDGLTFLKNLMRLRPLPVVMISSLTEQGSTLALEALALGAVDYTSKPSTDELGNIQTYAKKITEMVKNAAKAKVTVKNYSEKIILNLDKAIYESDFLKNHVIAMGSSTGGIEALESILKQLPKTFPGIVLTQHIRQDFVFPFANRMNNLCRVEVVEAKDGDEIVPGSVYIAPSDHHLTVKFRKNYFYCALTTTPPVSGHRPSVDVLFRSVAESAGSRGIGVLLTGMGVDGANGAKEIHDAGGIVIAQDEATSVVWGMPGAAIELKAADYITPLPDIPQQLFQILDTMAQKPSSQGKWGSSQ
ncbi:MAG TPA: chemotaxis response regulator protein-glutamate methylesterase [Gammaproteobacteria bacterium]|nr:chemotaxis response regulator protein-glutamate methylesterase [Gammaproteobacteria bacterium]